MATPLYIFQFVYKNLKLYTVLKIQIVCQGVTVKVCAVCLKSAQMHLLFIRLHFQSFCHFSLCLFRMLSLWGWHPCLVFVNLLFGDDDIDNNGDNYEKYKKLLLIVMYIYFHKQLLKSGILWQSGERWVTENSKVLKSTFDKWIKYLILFGGHR